MTGDRGEKKSSGGQPSPIRHGSGDGASPTSRGGGSGNEGKELLRLTLSGLRPLRGDVGRHRRPNPRPPRPLRPSRPAPDFLCWSEAQRIEGRRRDFAAAELERLRAERPPANRSLDLHGLRADEARRALEREIARAVEAGERRLLVVHGRGAHAEGEPVLRGQLVRWLTEAPNAHWVLAFATTRSSRGGATLVRLKLKRGRPPRDRSRTP